MSDSIRRDRLWFTCLQEALVDAVKLALTVLPRTEPATHGLLRDLDACLGVVTLGLSEMGISPIGRGMGEWASKLVEDCPSPLRDAYRRAEEAGNAALVEAILTVANRMGDLGIKTPGVPQVRHDAAPYLAGDLAPASGWGIARR